jgi:glutaconate CoA-transferase, subunit B
VTGIADLLTTVVARELVGAQARGLRVLAVTSPIAFVAGLAARRLGAPDVALATGFCVLDAVDAFPAVTLGEGNLGVAGAARGPSSDTFVALARGRVGVCVSPAQVDVRGATNLSRVGGTNDAPKVALPGSRGLAENNDAPGPLWYLFTNHDSRTLVPEVDFVSGPPPSAGRYRRLITPLGIFSLEGGAWTAETLTDGVTADDVAAGTGFPIAVPDGVATTMAPTDEELAALDAVDPLGLRALETARGEEAAELVKRAVAAERELR